MDIICNTIVKSIIICSSTVWQLKNRERIVNERKRGNYGNYVLVIGDKLNDHYILLQGMAIRIIVRFLIRFITVGTGMVVEAVGL